MYPLTHGFAGPDSPVRRRHDVPRIRSLRASTLRSLTLAVLFLLIPLPARAVLDIGDNGPILDAGGFRMRVTNAGIVGNAFLDAGRSFDPSLEFPPYSGIEMLNYASLMVGAIDDRGRTRVSGGPLLEFRPTLDPDDRVRAAQRGEAGTLWRRDDDGDGAIDEERLNGRDDDGDGLVDEDMGFTFDRLMTAQYVDDRPEAVNFAYEGGETHIPLGLTVHQEVGAWSRVGFNRVALLRFLVTNHSDRPLSDVYIGLLVDLDARLREDRSGHLDDEVVSRSSSQMFNEGIGRNIINVSRRRQDLGCAQGGPPPPAPCLVTRSYTAYGVADGFDAALPSVYVIPIDHSTDPLARIGPVAQYAKAPATTSFHFSRFSAQGVSGQGGVPKFDRDRYEALAGRLAQSVQPRTDQVSVLSCGPFRTLEPGNTLFFEAAIVVTASPDSVRSALDNIVYLHQGYWADLIPNDMSRDSLEYFTGRSGRNGHESLIEAPAGVSFLYDAHCGAKWGAECGPGIDAPLTRYDPGVPVWTDADCDECTGFRGLETRIRWVDPGQVPPVPRMRTTPGDHVVEIAWDNTPEALLAAGQYGSALSTFLGYRVYRLADWRGRRGLLPPLENWSLRVAFGSDTLNGERPLAEVLDTTVAPEGTLFGETLYPPGRYVFRDRTALNGFDYVYVVTAVYELRVSGGPQGAEISILESPIIASFEDRVSPQAATRDDGNAVWVVPNPFRGSAGWDRQPTLGDPLPRHIDFMGLPSGRSTIRIWTVAGDLVAQIVHDGSGGDGQASWDLISRNGQEVESGIYLFTVDSSLGIQRGRFVVVR